jgi:hypothetical protein
MTPISRRNILELIGNHRGKYHSCILTCYNFDFSFFEEQVLPKLRTANIKNINVFADGHILEQAQELTTGREFYYNKAYNFLPVYEKGVFHPKILLLTGLKHGLLIIGSGNITSSGLSTNDEIWGAFHLDNIENENASIFKSVWDYLQKYASINYGFLQQKIDWIRKYSPWLETLLSEKGPVNLPSINQKVHFVANLDNLSIYKQLIKLVPKENLKSITVISPYYDKSGQFIQQLYDDFQPSEMNCIIDSQYGVLPTELDMNYKQIISFFNWGDCLEKYEDSVNRLHAKIIHFVYSNESEYMLLGSANASMAAMGGYRKLAKNAEASLLVFRNQKSNWLEDLKINLPDKKLDISSFNQVNGFSDSSSTRNNYRNRILYAELKGYDLTCYLKESNTDDVWIVVIARSGEVQKKILANPNDNKITCRLAELENVFKLFLEDTNGKRCSNYIIIHRFEALLRCNPDPTQEKLDTLLENDFPDDEGFTSLLEYVDYDWADDESNSNNTLKHKIVRASTNSEYPNQENKYERLNAEEFNKISEEVIAHQSGLFTNANVKIADFLNVVISGEVQKSSDFSESDEQKIFEDADQIGEGEEIKSHVVKKINANKEKRAILLYYQKLEKIYTDKLDNFFTSKALTENPKELITIKTLSKALIALQILSIYHGKKFCQISEADESHLIEEYYINFGKITDGNDTVKGFLMNVLGKFLLLATGGFKNYEYGILNQKLKSYRIQLFEKALFLCLNNDWRNEEEKNYLKLLLLNLHYFVLPCDIIGENYFTQLKANVAIFRKKSKFVSSAFADNLMTYENNFLPGFLQWYNLFSNKIKRNQYLVKSTNDLMQETIIFSSRIGFNKVLKITKGIFPSLDLIRDGYPSNGVDYELFNFSYGLNCIVYN